MRITADDVYKLYINGAFVMSGPAPSYPRAHYYNEKKIDRFLHPGENEILVHTYYQGLCNRHLYSGDLRHGLWFELTCDGDTVCVSDTDWEYAYDNSYEEARTIGYDTQFLENINAYGKELRFLPALRVLYDDHKLIRQPTETCDLTEMRPNRIIRISDSDHIFDLGKERSGILRIYASPANLGEVSISYAEELTGDGRAMSDMRCMSGVVEHWVLDGKTTLEGFESKAARFIEIRGNVDPETVTFLVKSYPLGEDRRFVTGNDRLDGILEICRQAVITATGETFTDCPTREKGQYLGDMMVTALAHFHITGDAAMYRKALLDFAASADICPGLMCCAPCAYMQEIADFSLLYPYQVYRYYLITGDVDTVRLLYPVIEGMLDHFAKFRRHDGLLENVTDKWNLVDWPDNMRDDYDFPLTNPTGQGCHNVINAYYYGALRYAGMLAGLLGLKAGYSADELLCSYKKAFYRRERSLFADSETSGHFSLHSNALPLFFGMAEDPEPIYGLIAEKGLSCGVFFAFFVLEGLCASGNKDLAMSLILNDGEHSWINMIREGATTCFEAWGKDQKWNTSLCHPWAAAPLVIVCDHFPGLLS